LKYAGGEAAGTGMVLTSSGEVVTNHHVVEGATSIRVKVMSTGTTYRAEVVGTDAADDVAVLQLEDATGLATVTPDTDGIGVGDDVTAVGDAGGSTSTFSAADGRSPRPPRTSPPTARAAAPPRGSGA
jgi:S1-C subfamily serine protease